jgi:hypothetical protein
MSYETRLLKHMTLWQTVTIMFYGLGLSGIGYNVFGYLFLGEDTFSDFLLSTLFAPVYYDPILGDEANSNFSQPIGPPLIHYYLLMRKIFPSLDVYSQELMPLGTAALVLCILLAVLLALLYTITKNLKISSLLIFSHPILFVFGRGNPDIALCILLSIFVFLQIHNLHGWSAFLLSLMISIKLPLIILVGLFISQKRWKSIVQTCLGTGIFFVGSLFVRPFDLKEQLETFEVVTGRYFRDYVVGDGGTLFNNSLFGLIKSFIYITNFSGFTSNAELIQVNTIVANIYPLIAIFFLVAVCTYLIGTRKVFTNQKVFSSESLLEFDWSEILFLLIILYILLPQISAEYRLSFLVPSLAALYSHRSRLLYNKNFLILVGALMTPKHFLIIADTREIFGSFTIGSIINPILLILLFFCTLRILWSPSQESKKSKSRPS